MGEPLTLEAVRERLVACFVEAQQATFERAALRVGVRPSPEELRRTVAVSVRATFREVGGDYDRPTHGAIDAVVVRLAEKARAWGTPEEVVDGHVAELRGHLARCAKDEG